MVDTEERSPFGVGFMNIVPLGVATDRESAKVRAAGGVEADEGTLPAVNVNELGRVDNDCAVVIFVGDYGRAVPL